MIKKLPALFLSLLCIQLIPTSVLGDYWTQKANYPGNGSSRAFCFSIDDKGYFGCGDNGSNASDFWQYDTTSNTWTSKAAFGGGGRWSGVSFSVGGFGYAGLGWNAGMMDDMWKYDAVADSWTQMNNFAGGQRQVPTSFVIGNKAYVATGRNNSNVFLNDLWEYDPVPDVWTQLANFPGIARSQPFAFAIDTLGYVGGGFDQSLNGLNDFYEYNPANNTWTVRAPLPASGRGDPAGFAIGCRGYAGTGQTLPVNSVLNDIWEFNPAMNQWIAKAPFGGSARDESAFFTIGGKGYIGLGGVNGGSLTNDFWEYTPDTTCITVIPLASFTAPNHICPGTCTDFTNLSSNGTSYLWTFTGANPTTSTDFSPSVICYNTPGTYPVTLITTNAFGSDTLTLNNYITVYPYPAPQGIFQSGDSLFANAGAVSYQWYYNGLLIAGATESFYVAPAGGDYNVVATNANGCEVEAAIFDVIAGIPFLPGNGQWEIFPNPVNNLLSVQNINPGNIQTAINSITIYNTLGDIVLTGSLPIAQLPFDVSSMSAGMYWLEIKAPDKSYRMKFIKSSSR
ncbi:MAG: kelch repeat-containing protein [Bacteroidota bacterium]